MFDINAMVFKWFSLSANCLCLIVDIYFLTSNIVLCLTALLSSFNIYLSISVVLINIFISRISQCKLLGSDYIKIVQEYENIDEEIKTKEWVKEQLQNGPKDDSLFDDSFNE